MMNEGTMETEGAPLWIPPEVLKEAVAQTAKIKAEMSPPGMLGLPELLEKRRLEFGIPDTAFRVQAAHNRVFVHKIEDEMYKNGRYGKDSVIELPETTKKALATQCPRGIIISAGLSALDTLRDHGMDVGHVVTLLRVAPWRVVYDIIGGEQFAFLVVQDRDIVGSEDTARMLASRQLLRDTVKLEGGREVSVYKTREGTIRVPVETQAAEDM